jgi:hypothetical protein
VISGYSERIVSPAASMNVTEKVCASFWTSLHINGEVVCWRFAVVALVLAGPHKF